MSADVYVLKRFGGGSGSIVLDNVQCTGYESSLSNCSTLSVHNNCEHSEDAGVRCLNGKFYVAKTTIYSPGPDEMVFVAFGTSSVKMY